MPVITTPISPLEAGGEMFFREKTQSIFLARTSTARPVSEAFDTEFEDSDVEEGSAPKHSFDSVSEVQLGHPLHVIDDPCRTTVVEEVKQQSLLTMRRQHQTHIEVEAASLSLLSSPSKVRKARIFSDPRNHLLNWRPSTHCKCLHYYPRKSHLARPLLSQTTP
jgi:hypothetical protein